MAANTAPLFALTPQVPAVTITGTTTDKSGATTANIKILYTAATNGTKVSQIGYKFLGTSTAGILLIWITDTSGLNPILFDEILYGAVTSSNTVATARIVNSYTDLELKSGQQIWVGCTTVNTNVYVFAQIGDF